MAIQWPLKEGGTCAVTYRLGSIYLRLRAVWQPTIWGLFPLDVEVLGMGRRCLRAIGWTRKTRKDDEAVANGDIVLVPA